MKAEGAVGAALGELQKPADPPVEVCREATAKRPRIALLTPYAGGSLGDAAIQDALIANLRLRLPGVQFSGITLNCENFLERHGESAFPLCASHNPLYKMSEGKVESWAWDNGIAAPPSDEKALPLNPIKRTLKRMPTLWACLKMFHSIAKRPWDEVRHCFVGYRFLRRQDLLIVSGGGQLDQEWGGAWAHPFALFKWAVLARVARLPCAITSVGACKIESATCRVFLSVALRLARYRSYRDKNSRALAARMLRRAADDPVVPDLAFSMPASELPAPANMRSISQGRTVVAISPIAYARPGKWACEDTALYNRYLHEMASVTSQLLQRNCFLVFVWSAIGDDDRVVPEILERVDDAIRKKFEGQIHIPRIMTWKDLVGILLDVDCLIASRLHSTILGFVTKKPTIAISFDPKVDWVMGDLAQNDFLLQISDFKAEAVIRAFDGLMLRRSKVEEEMSAYGKQTLAAFTSQYDVIAKLAMASQSRGD